MSCRWLFDGVDRGERITWPSDGRYPDAHFDHAFADGLEVESITVPADFDHCSDHRPVVVEIGAKSG
jgi:endonuclease/exonuclease/phosphatase (EEP) superfamily protein YafD